MRSIAVLCFLISGVVLVGLAPRGDAQSCTTTRVSSGPGGSDVPTGKGGPRVTPDGRYVAFFSWGDGITPNDTNDCADIFVHDRQTGLTEFVSVSSTGSIGDSDSYDPRISDDGRYVAFFSFATNFVAGDTPSSGDVFVRDRWTGQTECVSVDSGGNLGNGTTYLNDMSADGNRIVMTSYADDLVAGDTNGFLDVYLHERSTGLTTRMSTGLAGAEPDDGSYGAALSADGNWVVFLSYATNLVPNDTNGFEDAFLRELATGQVQRVNTGPGGVEADQPAGYTTLSGDARYVAIETGASNLAAGDNVGTQDVLVLDRTSGIFRIGNLAPGGLHGTRGAWNHFLSRDGRYLAFVTPDELEPGHPGAPEDIYLADLFGTDFARVVRGWTGQPAAMNCDVPQLAQSPSVVVFTSEDPDLVPNDTPWSNDVFVRECPFPPTPAYSAHCTGTAVDCPCANAGGGWGGCDDSFGDAGAELAAFGNASLSADGLRIYCWRLPQDVPTLLLQAPLSVARTPWGDGLVCLGGGTNRLGIRFAHGGMVQLGFGIPGDPSLATLANLPPTGGSRSYQLVYRNPDPTFCTSATFNTSNSIEVPWAP